MRFRRIPKRLWMIVDPSCPGDVVLGWFATKSDARRHCDKFNRIPGYEPTCVVVHYEMTPEKRSTPR